MYLLIPSGADRESSTGEKFTFHNVSINSDTVGKKRAIEINLHSIMYLLILVPDL